MTGRYYVCRWCGHYWSSPAPPERGRCESCGSAHAVRSFATIEQAEAESDAVLATAPGDR